MAESKPTIDNLRVAAERRRDAEIEYLSIENAILRAEIEELRQQLNPSPGNRNPSGNGRRKKK